MNTKCNTADKQLKCKFMSLKVCVGGGERIPSLPTVVAETTHPPHVFSSKLILFE